MRTLQASISAGKPVHDPWVPLLRWIGLVAPLSLALLALVGAGSAVADTLCDENTNPCPTGHEYAAPKDFDASVDANGAVLETDGSPIFINPTVTCTESEATVRNTETSDDPIEGQVTALTFDDCTNDVNGQACDVDVQNLNYDGVVAATSGGDGTLTVYNPRAEVDCDIPLAPVCTYSAESVTGDVHGGDPAWITFDQVPLDIVDSSFLCPTEATWTATYVLHDDNGNPTAVWVEPLP